MNSWRRILTILVFLSALGAGLAALLIESPVPAETPISDLAAVPWAKATLLAYTFGTILVPLGLADVNETVKKTLAIWALLLLVVGLIWLVPCLLALKYGWTWDGCFTFSILVMLVPTLAEPLGFLKSSREKRANRA